MKAKSIALLAGLGLAAVSLASTDASAAVNGWTTRPVTQHAGPGNQYPPVGFLPAGVNVRIFGCVRGLRSCDVAWRGNRGWVSGNALAGFYRNKRVPLVSFGVQLGLPIIAFNFGYWDDHYRGKPFFRERAKWDKDWRKGPGDKGFPINMPKKKFEDNDQGMGAGDRNGPRRDRETECKPGSMSPDCKSSSMN
jgi:uncharacterized protein YraI